jgi:putrescine importer
VFPKVIFARLSKRFHTPWLNILITVVASAPAFIYSLATTTSFVNFGAFTAFTFVNIGVIGLVIREKSLRRKAWPIVLVLLPALGALVNVYLLLNLDMTAIRLGLIWMAIGVVALAVITKGFRVAPPEMSFTEEEAILEEREDESGSTTVIPEAAQART